MSNRSANNVFIIVRRSSVIFEFFAYMESIKSIAVLDNDCGIVSGVVMECSMWINRQFVVP